MRKIEFSGKKLMVELFMATIFSFMCVVKFEWIILYLCLLLERDYFGVLDEVYLISARTKFLIEFLDMPNFYVMSLPEIVKTLTIPLTYLSNLLVSYIANKPYTLHPSPTQN